MLGILLVTCFSVWVPYHSFIPKGNCVCEHERCVMEHSSDSANPPKLWSNCSVDSITTALTRADNNLARCLHNMPMDPDGTPVCGDCIIQRGEECDCGSPQVSCIGNDNHAFGITECSSAVMHYVIARGMLFVCIIHCLTHVLCKLYYTYIIVDTIGA